MKTMTTQSKPCPFAAALAGLLACAVLTPAAVEGSPKNPDFTKQAESPEKRAQLPETIGAKDATAVPVNAEPGEEMNATPNAEPKEKPVIPDYPAIPAAKSHIRSILKGDYAVLKTTYAPQVDLLKGHKHLAAGATIDQAKLIGMMKKAHEDRAAEEVEKILGSVEYIPLPVELLTQDLPDDRPIAYWIIAFKDRLQKGRLQEGDVLINVRPRRGAEIIGMYFVLQFRKIDGTWQIVAEYSDPD